MSWPLLRLAVAGLRAHALRLLLTAFAVLVGTGFLTGTLIYGDTARGAFYDDLARSARNVDVVVEPYDELVEPEIAATLRGLDGVRAVDGRVIAWVGVLGPDGRLLTSRGHAGYALSLPGDPALAPYDLAGGRLPRVAGEVAMDADTVRGSGFSLGGPVTLLDEAGTPRVATLVGLLDLGANRRFGGSPVVALTDADLFGLTGTRRYAQVVLAAEPGTGADRLAGRVAGAVGDRYAVSTGDRLRDRLARQAAKYVDGFQAVLLGFGLVALVVSGFVIHNSVTMLTAARLRELGLLRCAGATRRQVTGLVLLEAAGLGLVGALGGMAAGLLVGVGLLHGRELVAAQALPAHPLVVRAPTVLAAVAFGVGVTVLGALAAAIRAGRVAPLVALRDLGEPVTPDSSRPARRRIRWAVLLAGAGVLVAVLGLRFAFAGLPLVLGGGMLLFLGTVVAAPVLVPGLLAGPERVAGRFLGPVAELVVTSARRDPRRVAATGTALMIGVALMAMFGVLLATARDQSGRELEENFPVAYVLDRVGLDGRTDPVPRPLPVELTTALRADPAFASVTEVRTTLTTDRLRVWAVPAEQLRGPVRPEVTAGDLAGLRPGAVAVSRKLAAARGVGPGDRLDLGGLGTVVVVALYDDSPVDGAVLVSWEQFTAGYGPGAPDRLLLDLAPGLDPAAGRRAVDAAVRSHPLVRVNSLAERTAALTGTLDELLGIFTAVLGLSVLIALLGIGNTMSLAVVERTGEFRAMRAQGLSRRQLAGLVLAEAALVGVVGAVGGVALGGAVGWVAAAGLIDSYGHGHPVLPADWLVLCVALAVGSAVLAGVLPARRAARVRLV